MTTTRTIVVGDIHGCFEELQKLLSDLSFQDSDELVSIGDLIDRGPYPKEVVSFFRNTHNASAILGNHEDKHIRIYNGELKPSFSQKICIEQMGSFYEEAIQYMKSLPLYMERGNFYLVHAGLLADIHPSLQPRNTILRGKMPWMKNSYDKRFGGWWKHYNGHKPVVFGHNVFHEVNVENRTFGIDTGVCHGNKLSALILEDQRICSVAAVENHWQILKKNY